MRSSRCSIATEDTVRTRRRCDAWTHGRSAESPLVVRPARPEPQAGDLPLPAVRTPSARAERAHADVSRGRSQPAPPRPLRLRPEGPAGRPAAHPGGVAEDPAPTPTAKRVAAARGAGPPGRLSGVQNARKPPPHGRNGDISTPQVLMSR